MTRAPSLRGGARDALGIECHVVELRYFGGLTVEETAEALGISPETVARGWRLARAWLRRELDGR